jgi:hypothetical protein
MVTFYPHKPITSLENHIQKGDGTPLQGEIDIYRKLYQACSQSSLQWHIWHDLKLPIHSNTFNPYRKGESQIDFLIICEEGVMVLEVKGGQVSFSGNKFYYGNLEKEMQQDPFRQVEGYMYTVKERIFNAMDNIFFARAVALPHATFPFTRIFDPNILWTANSTSNPAFHNDKGEVDFSLFILSVFRHLKGKQYNMGRPYKKLTNTEIKRLVSQVSPTWISRGWNESSTLEWLNIENVEVMNGLNKNMRVMIEGGPGTGKTTYAKAYIDMQVGKRGIYICWNRFLRSKIEYEIKQRKIAGECEVVTLPQFLYSLSKQFSVGLTFHDSSIPEFYSDTNKLIKFLKENGHIRYYDYMIIDEGQDTFDRGVDILIDHLLDETGNGISNGRAVVFYDIDQSYDNEDRDLREIVDVFLGPFVHYKLHDVHRCCQNKEIKDLANKIISTKGSVQLKQSDYTRIQIHKYNSLDQIKTHIRDKIVRGRINDEQDTLNGKDCVLLIQSHLLMADPLNNTPGMEFLLKDIKGIVELTEDNVGQAENILKYTSILKYKGLEQCNVFVIMEELSESNCYEAYVAVTRAILNLELFILKK